MLTKDGIITGLQKQVEELRQELKAQKDEYEAKIASLNRRLNASATEIEIDHGKVTISGECRTIVYTDAREVVRK